MRTVYHLGLLAALLLGGPTGCATAPPPSESLIVALRAQHRDLMTRVASGELTAGQARDRFYAALDAARPLLPDIESLKAFRRQLAAQMETGQLTRDQAESLLTAREAALLQHWTDMAAQDAREQREIQRLRDEQERGLWQQKQLEQGEKVFRDRPRL